MKKSLILFICFLFSLSLIFSCSSFRMKTESEKAKKTGNIAGIVFDGNTGEPMAGVTIYIKEIQTIHTRSDSLGRFWLSFVPIGGYEVWAERIYYYRGEIKEVEVFNHSTSIVLYYLRHTTIPERPHWYDWDGKIIKTDSISFFITQYKNLLKKK